MPKFKVCVEEVVEYEIFVDAKDADEADTKARRKATDMGPIQRARATIGVSDMEVSYCAEWSA